MKRREFSASPEASADDDGDDERNASDNDDSGKAPRREQPRQRRRMIVLSAESSPLPSTPSPRASPPLVIPAPGERNDVVDIVESDSDSDMETDVPAVAERRDRNPVLRNELLEFVNSVVLFANRRLPESMSDEACAQLSSETRDKLIDQAKAFLEYMRAVVMPNKHSSEHVIARIVSCGTVLFRQACDSTGFYTQQSVETYIARHIKPALRLFKEIITMLPSSSARPMQLCEDLYERISQIASVLVDASANINRRNTSQPSLTDGEISIMQRADEATRYLDDELQQRRGNAHTPLSTLQNKMYPVQLTTAFMGYLLSKHYYRLDGTDNAVILHQVYTDDGYPTTVFVPLMSETTATAPEPMRIQDVLRDFLTKYHELTIMFDGAMQTILRRLESAGTEAFLPIYRPNRDYIAFNNGIYDLEHLTFMPWSERGTRGVDNAFHFIPQSFKPISDEEKRDWRVLRPKVRRFVDIFAHQNIPDDVYDYIWALLGRTLYDAEKHDKFQIGLFLQGLGGTGKSTIIAVLKAFFPVDNVGTLPANAQKDWGVADCLMRARVLAILEEEAGYNANSPWTLEMWKKLIAIEVMHGNRRNRTPLEMRIMAHMVVACQEMPFADDHHSMERRTAIVNFHCAVDKTTKNSNLKAEIYEHELCYILQMLAETYRRVAREATERRQGMIELPAYFAETLKLMNTRATTADMFIKQCNVFEFGPGKMMAQSQIIQMFSDFCERQKLPNRTPGLLPSSPAWRQFLVANNVTEIPWSAELRLDGQPVPADEVVLHGICIKDMRALPAAAAPAPPAPPLPAAPRLPAMAAPRLPAAAAAAAAAAPIPPMNQLVRLPEES